MAKYQVAPYTQEELDIMNNAKTLVVHTQNPDVPMDIFEAALQNYEIIVTLIVEARNERTVKLNRFRHLKITKK